MLKCVPPVLAATLLVLYVVAVKADPHMMAGKPESESPYETALQQ